MKSNARLEQSALLVGQLMGQLSELLNNIKNLPMSNDQIYRSVLDIIQCASLYAHEIYYKNSGVIPATSLWIRTDEHLPDADTDVLLWIDQDVNPGYTVPHVTIGKRLESFERDGLWEWVTEESYTHELLIKYWMPLPISPEVNDD